MGNYYFRIDTTQFNDAIRNHDALNDSVYAEKIIVLRKMLWDDQVLSIVQTAYTQQTIASKAKQQLLINLQKLFLQEFAILHAHMPLNNQELMAKTALEMCDLDNFIKNLKEDTLTVPLRLENLKKYIISFSECGNQKDQVLDDYQRCHKEISDIRQRAALADVCRSYHLQGEKFSQLEDFENLNLSDKLTNYLKNYLNQEYLLSLGANLIELELAQFANIQAKGHYINIIPLADGCQVDMILRYNAKPTEDNQSNITKATALVSLGIKDQNPNSDDVNSIQATLETVAINFYDEQLNPITNNTINPNVIIEKLVHDKPLLEAERAWLAARAQQFTDYQAMPTEILIWLCKQNNVIPSVLISGWMNKNQESDLFKLPLDHLAWLYNAAPDCLHDVFVRQHIDFRFLLEEDKKHASLVNDANENLSTAWDMRVSQIELFANNPAFISGWIQNNDKIKKLPIYNAVRQYVRLNSQEHDKQDIILKIVRSIPFLQSLTTKQFVELATDGNLQVTKAMIAPWTNKFNYSLQRIWFDWRHPMHHLSDNEISQIFIGNASWCVQEECPLFKKQSWLRESWLGRLFFGAPLRYRLSNDAYEAILNKVSATERPIIVSKMLSDVKLHSKLKAIIQTNDLIKQTYYQCSRHRPYMLADIYQPNSFSNKLLPEKYLDELTKYLKSSTAEVKIKEFQECPNLVDHSLDDWADVVIKHHESRLIKILKNQPLLLEKTAVAFILKANVRGVCYQKPKLLQMVFNYLSRSNHVLYPYFYKSLSNDSLGQKDTRYSHSRLTKTIRANNIVPVDVRELGAYPSWIEEGRKTELDRASFADLLLYGEFSDFLLAFYDKPDMVKRAMLTSVAWESCYEKSLPLELANFYLKTHSYEELAEICLESPSFFSALPKIQQTKLMGYLTVQQIKQKFQTILVKPNELKEFTANPHFMREVMVGEKPDDLMTLLRNDPANYVGQTFLKLYLTDFCLQKFIETSPLFLAKLFMLADSDVKAVILKNTIDAVLCDLAHVLQNNYSYNLSILPAANPFFERHPEIKQHLVDNEVRPLSPVPSVGASPVSVSTDNSSDSSDSSDTERDLQGNKILKQKLEQIVNEPPIPEDLSDDEKNASAAAYTVDHLFEAQRPNDSEPKVSISPPIHTH